ncbi:hypothetical protein GCM10009539_56560 [Cryptosporangium japonicum]|uniref:Uncharacterized protein n=2 Tax=Cryptosporangium japonicum TaxID=80872 RepID=A0ABN0UW64_9ACTN
MRLKLGVVVGVMTVLALAGGGSAAMASEGGGPTHDSSSEPGDRVASIGIASVKPISSAEIKKFTTCMRANGLPDFEAPTVTPPSGDEPGRVESVLPKDVDPEVARKATEKCAPAKPRPSAAQVKKLKRYAKCMRENGVENFPTPSADGSLRLSKDDVDPESDDFKAAEEACKKYAPARRVKERHHASGGERADGGPVLYSRAGAHH